MSLIPVYTGFSLGTFAECSSETEVQHWMRYNIFLLLDVGTFSALVELLNMEIEYALHWLLALHEYTNFGKSCMLDLTLENISRHFNLQRVTFCTEQNCEQLRTTEKNIKQFCVGLQVNIFLLSDLLVWRI